jgi:hypothetical protein
MLAGTGALGSKCPANSRLGAVTQTENVQSGCCIDTTSRWPSPDGHTRCWVEGRGYVLSDGRRAAAADRRERRGAQVDDVWWVERNRDDGPEQRTERSDDVEDQISGR